MLRENIKNRRKSLNLTLLELSEIIGVTEATLQRYESGNIKNIPYDKIEAIAKALKTSPAALMGWEDGSAIMSTSSYEVPLYASVSAGFGSMEEEAVGTFPCIVNSPEEAKNTICVIVNGDSMAPKIENGDILQVRCQSSVDDGDIAVVLLDGMEHFVKKVEYGPDFIRLVSLNMNYKPIILEGEDVLRCYIEGKVIAVTKKM